MPSIAPRLRNPTSSARLSALCGAALLHLAHSSVPRRITLVMRPRILSAAYCRELIQSVAHRFKPCCNAHQSLSRCAPRLCTASAHRQGSVKGGVAAPICRQRLLFRPEVPRSGNRRHAREGSRPQSRRRARSGWRGRWPSPFQFPSLFLGHACRGRTYRR